MNKKFPTVIKIIRKTNFYNLNKLLYKTIYVCVDLFKYGYSNKKRDVMKMKNNKYYEEN